MRHSYIDIKPEMRKFYFAARESKYFHAVPNSYLKNVLIPRCSIYTHRKDRWVYLGGGVFSNYLTATKWSYFGVSVCKNKLVTAYKFMEHWAHQKQIKIAGRGNYTFYYPEHIDISNLEEEANDYFKLL